MASEYYGVNYQTGKVDNTAVLIGTSTTSASLELVIDLASTFGNATIGKNEVLQALESIKAKIVAGNWPPP